MEPQDFLKDAIALLEDFATGRDGPVDAQHATALVQAMALIAVAQELRRANDRNDRLDGREDARQYREELRKQLLEEW